MRLYNSLSNQVEVFKPIYDDKVMMYFCGPTVYNYAHIGNGRAAIVSDLLRRVLENSGYNVIQVSNYTDIDDKIIAKALKENKDVLEVSKFYIEQYQKDMHSLNILTPHYTPQVSKVMDKIIVFIEQLITEGYAYELNGDVYFRVSKLQEYGMLSKHQLDDLYSGVRIEGNTQKENPSDFALWKKADQGIFWNASFSKGRPGWHTECVVMIYDTFKEKLIDIHGGGSDLRFPHHENEMAQSLACCSSKLANYWVHNGMLKMNGSKMSKSLGNIILLRDFIAHYDSNLARFILLSAHYRNTLTLSDEVNASLAKEFQKIEMAFQQAQIQLQLHDIAVSEQLDSSYFQFVAMLEDDLNTPNAYTILFEIVKKINITLRQKDKDFISLASYCYTLNKALNILGIQLQILKLSDEDKELFEKWTNFKNSKNFNEADKIRNLLSERGYL